MYDFGRGRRLLGMRRLAVDPVGVLRSYEVVSTRGTRGNSYQRLLVFTTARRKAPDFLIRAVLARYGVGRRMPYVRMSHELPGDAGRPVECVTIAIPGEPPPAARLRAATNDRRTNAAAPQGPRRP
jgi:hypothetical protein